MKNLELQTFPNREKKKKVKPFFGSFDWILKISNLKTKIFGFIKFPDINRLLVFINSKNYH